MRDSNSNNGYTVLYGLGCREARIAAGGLAEATVACAGTSMRQNMITPMYMAFPAKNVRFGILGFVVEGLADDLLF